MIDYPTPLSGDIEPGEGDMMRVATGHIGRNVYTTSDSAGVQDDIRGFSNEEPYGCCSGDDLDQT